MKTKVLKYFVLAATLAFMNCGDDAKDTLTSALDDKGLPNTAVDGFVPLLDENGNPVLDENGNQVMVQDTTQRVNPENNLNIDFGDGEPTDNPDPHGGDVEGQAGDPAVDPAAQGEDPAAQGGENATQAVSTKTQAGDPATQGNDPVSPKDSTKTDGGESAQTGDPANDTPAVTSSASEEPKVESSSSEVPKGIFLSEDTDETKGHLEIEYKEGQGPDGQSVLAYPKQLSTTQKHGIVVWGPGGGEKPGNYPNMIKDLAGQGFVVIGIKESPGDGHLAIQAIDWLEKQNSDAGSVFNGKLDLTKVGCSGHSMGGLESEQAAIKDKRVITAFLNNSGDQGSGAFVNIPKEKTAGVVFGEKGSERSNAIRDYQSAKETPACMIEMINGPMNSEGGWGYGSGPWDGRAITVAWMRWQLGGEDFRKADFVGTSGKYINGSIAGHQGNWKGECKNF